MPRFLQAPRTPIVRAVLLVTGVFIAGTIGYRVLENAPWWDAFFMTVITITTVGYEEEVSLSREGEIFTSFLILAGLGMLLFLLTELSRSVVEGELRQFLGRVRRSRMIERLTARNRVRIRADGSSRRRRIEEGWAHGGSGGAEP